MDRRQDDYLQSRVVERFELRTRNQMMNTVRKWWHERIAIEEDRIQTLM